MSFANVTAQIHSLTHTNTHTHVCAQHTLPYLSPKPHNLFDAYRSDVRVRLCLAYACGSYTMLAAMCKKMLRNYYWHWKVIVRGGSKYFSTSSSFIYGAWTKTDILFGWNLFESVDELYPFTSEEWTNTMNERKKWRNSTIPLGAIMNKQYFFISKIIQVDSL